jgi:ureidoacrylate peracid hydrolase
VASIQQIIEPCKKVIEAVRSRGCKIIYFQMGIDPTLHFTGGAGSPNWYKSNFLKMMREHPELLDGKPLIFGTHDADFIPELRPEKEDVIIRKQRFSGFFGTNLQQALVTYNIKYLVFIGVATNVCVESTIRDAFFFDYFPILVSDAAQTNEPDICHKATLYNVEHHFGWVTTTQNILKAFDSRRETL